MSSGRLFRRAFAALVVSTATMLCAGSLAQELPPLNAAEPQDSSSIVDPTRTAAPAPTAPNEKIVYWEVGVTITPKTWPVRGGTVRIPIPSDWPEQKVTLYSAPSESDLSYDQKTIEGGLNILEVSVPRIAKGDQAKLLLTYQVILTPLPVPDQARYFKKPEKPGRELIPYLGSSPLIDPKHASIKKLVAEVAGDVADDWPRVEKMYDWVLANIALTADEPVGAVKVLANKKGHREDRINLFIAMCRQSKIPARTVWANGMEYAEFYLVDGQGFGHWLPCQLSGAREFGSLTKLAVIEQKGEAIKLPGSTERRRFINATASIATERNARADPERPSISFIRRPTTQPTSDK